MNQDELKFVVGPVRQDRRGWISIAPPFLTEEGMVLIDRREPITVFGSFSYRAWVDCKTGRSAPWDGWFEIYALDCETLLVGPTRMDRDFVEPEGAYAAAAQKAKWEILNLIVNRKAATAQSGARKN